MARSPFKEAPETIEVEVDELHKAINQRAKQLAEESHEIGGLENEEVDPDELRALAELDATGDVKFQVIRILPADKKGFVMELSAGELTMLKIQTECGAGRYRVRGVRSNGQYAGSRTIDIAPPSVTTINHTQNSGQDSMKEFLAYMEAKDSQRRQEFKEWAAILVPVLAPIIPQLFGQKGPTLADLTQTMVNMKQLNGGDSSKSKIEEVAALIGMVKDLTPESDKGSSWPDIIRDGIKEIGPLAAGVIGARAGMAPPPSSAPTVTVAVPQPAQVKQEGNPMMALLAWLKEQLSALAHQAALNKNPELYAEVLVDNLPSGADPKQLLEYLQRPDWWQVLVQFVPNVNPYPQWFAECRKSIIDLLRQELAAVQAGPATDTTMPSDADE